MPEPAVPTDVAAPSSFVNAVRRALRDTPAGVDAWFHRYHGDLGDDRGLRTWVRAKRQLLDLVGGVRGRVVVDAGSGFGMVSNLLASWNASRVWAVEVHTPMVESHRRVNAACFPHLEGRVVPVRADVSRLPLASGTADVVLSIEAISHYYDVDAFFDECARVLRPDGWLVISDGNNGANPRIRTYTEELWQRFESGPEGMFGTHEVPEPMLSRRERIIREGFPALDATRAHALAERTSGFDRSRIVEAVSAHLAGGPEPSSWYHRGDCPREPQWGYWLERLFDPRELARTIARRGFSARAIPHFGGASNDVVHAANLVLRRLPTHALAHAYRVVARRRGS